MKTAITDIINQNDNCFTTNILVDEGSQDSFIVKSHADRMGIKPCKTVTKTINGYGGQRVTKEFGVAPLKIKTLDGVIEISCLITDTPIANPIIQKNWKQVIDNPKNVAFKPFANPIVSDYFNVDLLLGLGEFGKFLCDGIYVPEDGGLIFQHSKFGSLAWGQSNKIKISDESHSYLLYEEVKVEEHEIKEEENSTPSNWRKDFLSRTKFNKPSEILKNEIKLPYKKSRKKKLEHPKHFEMEHYSVLRERHTYTNKKDLETKGSMFGEVVRIYEAKIENSPEVNTPEVRTRTFPSSLRSTMDQRSLSPGRMWNPSCSSKAPF